MKIGCIEAGGTKFVLAIGNELGNILEKQKLIPKPLKKIWMK